MRQKLKANKAADKDSCQTESHHGYKFVLHADDMR